MGWQTDGKGWVETHEGVCGFTLRLLDWRGELHPLAGILTTLDGVMDQFYVRAMLNGEEVWAHQFAASSVEEAQKTAAFAFRDWATELLRLANETVRRTVK
jgi:hypothetical protein